MIVLSGPYPSSIFLVIGLYVIPYFIVLKLISKTPIFSRPIQKLSLLQKALISVFGLIIYTLILLVYLGMFDTESISIINSKG